MQFLKEAVTRGERAAMFIFDEDLDLLASRALQLGVDLQAMRHAGDLVLITLTPPIVTQESSPTSTGACA